jgi:hypothetical protein
MEKTCSVCGHLRIRHIYCKRECTAPGCDCEIYREEGDPIDTSDLIDAYARELSKKERCVWGQGFRHAVFLFSIWKDGKEMIGCRHTRTEILKQLDKEIGKLNG